MRHYNPRKPPDPEECLELDETMRIILVEKYRRQRRIRMPNLKVHSIIHVVVENQVAEGKRIPTARILNRLMSEGLDRHEAVHAIGSVVAKYMFHALKGTAVPDAPQAYFQELESFTAQAWFEAHS